MYQDPIIDKIIVARVGLLLRHPFFGNMATRMKLIDASDWLPTAATDFRNLYYNREFFEQLNPRQVEFVVAHEILHCVYDHMNRREDRDPRIWNIAADFCVNGLLKRERIGEDPPLKFFHDTKYYGWSAEQVYDEIYGKYDDEELAALGEMLDEHLDPDKDGNGNSPKYSKEELKKIRDEIKGAMLEAASAASVPEEIARMIKEMTEHKMDWRELLRQQIQSIVKNDFSFSRPNRKGWHSGAILPGCNFDTTIDICISIDMSGSITDSMGEDFLGEIKGIMNEFKDFNLRVWSFDTRVYNEQSFDAYNADEIREYKLMGGGGTDFMCNWEYMKEHDIVPKKFIMFTDGYPWDSWGDEDYCDTTFVIHGNENIVSPWGQYAHYEALKKT